MMKVYKLNMLTLMKKIRTRNSIIDKVNMKNVNDYSQ